MSVENITPGSGMYRASKGYFDAKKRTVQSEKNADKASGTTSDNVQISGTAREMRQKQLLAGEFTDMLKNLPEPGVRQDKIGTAVSNIMNGYYDKESVQNQTAGALMDEQAGPAENTALAPETDTADLDHQKIEDVQKKILENYYDNIEVIETVVDKLLNR